MEILKLSAFACGNAGGNPAGVAILDELPSEAIMQSTAAEVGFSETVFAAPTGDDWRVRYFSPEAEVPFCGHATIALGAALALVKGQGIYSLKLNHTDITVEGAIEQDGMSAALVSPPTSSHAPSPKQLRAALALFGLEASDLDPQIPPALIYGGSDHLALTLASRELLTGMSYDLEAGRKLMSEEGWVTILLAWREASDTFRTRNAFAFGGVYEDPATGSATAAYSGYLRDLSLLPEIEARFLQGVEMGIPSTLRAARAGDTRSIRISGNVRRLD